LWPGDSARERRSGENTVDDEMLGAPTDEVHLLVPPFSSHLRAVRLLAADAAMRAGLDVAETDDLRIAVDELCHALMTATDHRIHISIAAENNRVVARGSARSRGDGQHELKLPSISSTIVEAVADSHVLQSEDDKVMFVVVKQGRSVEASR
jgi:hypothetical protein